MSSCQQKRFNGDPGDTVFFDQMYQRTQHLYVVLTRPEGHPPMAVMVNLTSKRSYSDSTVALGESDHPFIKHATVVNYKGARLFNVQILKQQIDNKTVSAHYPFEPEILKRIQDGILQSPFTAGRIKKYCAERF